MLPDVVEAEIADLATDEAAEITSRIRGWVKQCPIDDIKRAYFGRVWLAMGYKSWSEWCDCELGGFKLRMGLFPTSGGRREVVAELSESGMSNRAIADVIAVGKSTICRDRRELPTVPNGTVDPTPTNVDVNRRVTGKDGREINTSNIGKRRHGNSTLQIRALEGTGFRLESVASILEELFTGTFDKTCTPDIARHAAREMRAYTARINKVLRMLEAPRNDR
jgi:hypothetical protein